MDFILFFIGAALFAAGVLLLVYNKRITSSYMGAMVKATGSKDFESRGASIYGRVRFYFAAALLIGIGGVLALASILAA